MSIRFDEDIGKRDREEANKKKFKKNDKRNNQEEQNQVQENERKKSKREMMSKIRDEVVTFLLCNRSVGVKFEVLLLFSLVYDHNIRSSGSHCSFDLKLYDLFSG